MSYLFNFLKVASIVVPITLVACTQSPEAIAQKYDNKIVHQPDANRGKDDGWFLVKNGKRRWIMHAAWLEKNGYKASEVIYISSAEFYAIPEDPEPIDK